MAARRLRLLWPLLSGAALLVTAIPAPAATAQQPTQRSGVTQINLPLLFQGTYLGDIPSMVRNDATVQVDVERLIALLGRRVSDQLAASIRDTAQSQAMVSLAALEPLGVVATYDPGTLEINVTVPIERQGAETLSAYEGPARGLTGAFEAPEDFSLTAIFTGRETYRWGTSNRASGFDPFRGSADIAGNIGGLDGVSFFAQFEYEGARSRFQRGNFLAVHDDVARAIRYSLGDIAPAAAGFQSSPLIGGVSVERQFGILQPFRNVRPSGQFSFVLENASTIDVVVNGATLRTIRLEPGQYNLRDFPFFNGLNQVELYVIDNFGRRLLTSFSQYFSARLLDRGLFEFGATAGVLERISQRSGSRYRTDRPAFTGYVRYGLTSDFTLGGNVQASSRQWMGGLEFGWATPIGTVGGLASLSHHSDLGGGHAFLLSYEGSARRLGPLIRPQLNLEFESTSRDFQPLTDIPLVNRYRYSVQGRFASQLPLDFGTGVSIAHFEGRAPEPDQTRYAATLSRRIGRINITGSYERVDTIGPLRQSRFLLTVNVPLGRTQSLRASFDTRDNLASLEYARFQRDEIDTIGMRANLSRGDSGVNLAGELAYNNNRFAALLEHHLIADRSLGRIRDHETSLTLGTQVALAGKSFAVGRPVGSRFAIISAHPTLEGAIVNVRQGPGRDNPQARADRLGPALVPTGNAYTPTDLRVDIENLPAGYDIGAGQYQVAPAAASGYAFTVGSDASRVVIGTALAVDGTPLGLLGGTVRSLDRPDERPVLIFTNRAGRFVATGLAPGRYELSLGDKGSLKIEVVVPADARGTIMLGTVTLGRKEGI